MAQKTKALEFEAHLEPDRTLRVPEDVAKQLTPGQRVWVILLPERLGKDDAAWGRLAVEQFLKGYAESDAIYDEL